MSNQLVFNDHVLETITHNDKIWFTTKTLAKALEYAKTDSVTQIHNIHRHEFSDTMTDTLESGVSKDRPNLKTRTRIFSLRGAHLIAMFARTPVAEEFRKWVLDILDKEVSEPTPIIIKPNRHLLPNREVLPKGIYHHKSKYNPYRACVWNGGEMIQVGVFPTIAEAVEAQKHYSVTGEIKQIQKPRSNKIRAKQPTVPEHFTKEDTFAHISMFLETAQMLSFYSYGKSLSRDLLAFVQEEALRQSH